VAEVQRYLQVRTTPFAVIGIETNFDDSKVPNGTYSEIINAV